MISIPETLIRNVRITHGLEGEQWLSSLENTVAAACKHWSLKLDGEFSNLTYNFVAPVKMSAGESAVLKIGPRNKDVLRQAKILKIFNGHGSVNLIDLWDHQGALLLERAEQPVEITAAHFCKVAKGLANNQRDKVNATDFTHVSIWGLGFEKFTRTRTVEADQARAIGLTDTFVHDADQIFKGLVKSTESEILLHGDLHHANILQRPNGECISIDPKGVWGDPCYEAGAFLRNPMPEVLQSPDLKRELNERMAIISSDMGYSLERIRKWAFVQAVLAGIWSVSDGPEQVKNWLRIAKLYEAN